MKKTILLFLLIGITKLSAQSYNPMLADSNRWTVTYTKDGGSGFDKAYLVIFDVKNEGRYFDELSRAYWSGAVEALVHPKRYAASLKDIKSRLYNE